MSSKQSGPGPRKDHRPRMVQPKHHDVYAHEPKTADAMVCDQCGVAYHAGKWSWGAPALADTRGGLCPACARIRDRYPAGTIRLHGGLGRYRAEIENMIANVEEVEKEEHPLERVIAVQESEDDLVVTTTGLHIARRIANKLERRFHTQADFRYPEEQHLLFVDMEVGP